LGFEIFVQKFPAQWEVWVRTPVPEAGPKRNLVPKFIRVSKKRGGSHERRNSPKPKPQRHHNLCLGWSQTTEKTGAVPWALSSLSRNTPRRGRWIAWTGPHIVPKQKHKIEMTIFFFMDSLFQLMGWVVASENKFCSSFKLTITNKIFRHSI